MNKKAQLVFAAPALLGALFLMSCMGGTGLATRAASDIEINGNYDAIFYGCRYFNDFETVVLLDNPDDHYALEPYAPDFNFRTYKSVSAADALSAAGNFLNCNGAFRTTQTRSIIGPGGEVLGYELRPLYQVFALGFEDALITRYWLRDNKVFVTITLDPSVEKMLMGGGIRTHSR